MKSVFFLLSVISNDPANNLFNSSLLISAVITLSSVLSGRIRSPYVPKIQKGWHFVK